MGSSTCCNKKAEKQDEVSITQDKTRVMDRPLGSTTSEQHK